MCKLSSAFSVEYLKRRLFLNVDTGDLYWHARPLDDFLSGKRPEAICKTWNTRFAGKMAGHVDSRGRYVVRIDATDYQTSRVVWTLSSGCFPSGDIDHINGDTRDNRPVNLRDVSRSLNNRNKAAKSGKSGYVGVLLHTSGLWHARMWVNNKKIGIGYFKTPEDAFAARIRAQEGLGFTARHMGTE